MSSMREALYTEAYFIVILVLLSYGFLFYAMATFGFVAEAFKNVSYAGMTMFKMLMSDEIGVVYSEVL